MSYKFIILPKANVEYYDALNWYALQQSSLAAKFAADIAILIDAILRNPESFRKFKRGYREALMEKYPYLIVYLINKKEEIITIVSIFHTSRNPVKKSRKIKNPVKSNSPGTNFT